MDNRVWNKGLLFNFIEAYKLHRCLWLKEDTFYYNNEKKTKAYKDLVNLVKDDFPNADEQLVKMKIKNIRCAFRKVLKKKQQDINYEPTLWYFDLLMFTVEDNNNSATTEDGHDDHKRSEVGN